MTGVQAFDDDCVSGICSFGSVLSISPGQHVLTARCEGVHVASMSLDVQDSSIVRSLVIAVFALNGRLVETGNQLVGRAGLTTAWWQVLGAIGYSPLPLPVAHIARNMGLSRQSVQRVVDLLAERGMVKYRTNPHHQRAKLVALTHAGRAALDAAEAAEAPLNQVVLTEIGGDRIATALEVLTEMNALMTRSNIIPSEDESEESVST